MTIVSMFKAATKAVGVLPEPLGRGLFHAVGTVYGMTNGGGARQLRANLDRIVPLASGPARRRGGRAMANYMRYYYEAFRLPALTPAQIDARVRTENLETLQRVLEEHGSCSGVLMHMGNWDLAGAWATRNLAPVHTIAEKLEPPELADFFLSFRRDLGMTIYQAVKGGHAIANIARDMAEGDCFAPILCDRDLSASGLEVTLCGHPLRVAAGGALLAHKTGAPMVPVYIVSESFKDDADRVRRAGTHWGVNLIIGEPIAPGDVDPNDREALRGDLVLMNQQWMDQLSGVLPQYVEHWHMLQKVFVADLDKDRLKRAQQRENGEL